MKRELDRKLGTLVYGFKYKETKGDEVVVDYNGREFMLPYYSTNITDMHRLIEHLIDQGIHLVLCHTKRDNLRVSHAKVWSPFNPDKSVAEHVHSQSSQAYAGAICKYLEKSMAMQHFEAGEYEDDDKTFIMTQDDFEKVA